MLNRAVLIVRPKQAYIDWAAGLDRDLRLITEFEANYRERERIRTRLRAVGGPVFSHEHQLDTPHRTPPPFSADPFCSTLRKTG